MRKNLEQELSLVQVDILRMGERVERALHKTIVALTHGDLRLARAVIAEDDEVDRLMVNIEDRCLTLIALQQPLATDLRAIGTALKIVTDLERMADHATDIAKIVLELDAKPLIKPLVDIPRMADLVAKMVRDGLTAYMRRDPDLAYEMIGYDDAVDHLHAQILKELLTIMMHDPSSVVQANQLIFVSHYLERMADHATNVGEGVLYMVTGERQNLNK